MKKLHYHVAPLHNLTKLDKPHHFIGSASLLVMGILFYSTMIIRFAMAASAPLPVVDYNQGQVLGTTTGVALAAIAQVDCLDEPCPIPVSLSVSKIGTGVITSTDNKINCGSVCAANYTAGTSVTLSASPIPVSWSGCSSATSSTCIVKLTASTIVQVNFSNTKPTVTTQTASRILSFGAVLNGSVITNTSLMTGWFRYSLTNPGVCNDTFGIRAPASGGISLLGGATAVNYSQNITNLTPNTTYYYCAIAGKDILGFGSVMNFTTQPASTIPQVTTEPVSFLQDTRALLNGTVNPNGFDSYGWFRYTTIARSTCQDNDNWGTKVIKWDGGFLGHGTIIRGFDAGVDGLVYGQVYYYCAFAKNQYGVGMGQVKNFSINNYTLQITMGGPGLGLATSTDGKIKCAGGYYDSSNQCSAPYQNGQSVTLTVSAQKGSHLQDWGISGCSSNNNVCTFTIISSINPYIRFELDTQTIDISGTGRGSISSNLGSGGPQDLSCSQTWCTSYYPAGTQVIYTALPNVGSTVVGWSGCLNLTGNTCQVTVGSITRLSVVFNTANSDNYNLYISNSSYQGYGNITGSPAGINCDLDGGLPPSPNNICTQSYLAGASVILTATPKQGYIFSRWDNPTGGLNSDCLNINNSVCTVVMNGNKNIYPVFSIGTVSSVIAMINTTSVSGTLTPGQSDATMSKVDLQVPSSAPVYLNGVQVGNDAGMPTTPTSMLKNIKVYLDGVQLGNTVTNLSWNGEYNYGWALFDPILLSAATTKTLVIKADIDSTATGTVRLGVWGLNFAGAGATVTGLPVKGPVMTIQVSAITLQPGGLYKLADNPTIHYLGNDSRRYIFPYIPDWTDWKKVFYSWGLSDGQVQTVSTSQLLRYSIGGNITVRPGTYLMQSMADSGSANVYAVSYPNILHLIAPDQLPIFYGASWASKVLKTPAAFFTNYKLGAPVAGVYPDATLVSYSNQSSMYIIYGGQAKKLATDAAVVVNRYNSNYVVLAPTNVTHPIGADITGAVACLIDPSQITPCNFGDASSSLTIHLAADTPTVSTVIPGQVGVKFLKINITNNTPQSVNLQGIRVTSDIMNPQTNLFNIKAFENSTQIGTTSDFTWNNEEGVYAWIWLSSPYISIPAGTTKTFTIQADVTSIAGGSFKLGVNKITVEPGGYEIKGLPIWGQQVKVLTSTLPALDVSLDSNTPASATISPNHVNIPFTTIKLTARNADVSLSALIIGTNETTGNSLTNVRACDVNVCSTAALSPSLNYYGMAYDVTFSTPLVITNGTSKILTFKADTTTTASGIIHLSIIGFSSFIPSATNFNPVGGLPIYGNKMYVNVPVSNPDLVITSVQVNQAYPSGGPIPKVGDIYITGVVTVKNQGVGKAFFGSFGSTVGAFIHASPLDPSTVMIAGSGPASAISGDGQNIPPGESRTYTFGSMQDPRLYTNPEFLGTAGNKTLYFAVDPSNVTSDAARGNNIFTYTLNVLSSSGSTPSIKLITPNGGEKWQAGKTYSIFWQSSNFPAGDTSRLVISTIKEGEILGYPISGLHNEINDGVARWTIPFNFTPGQYRIMITSIYDNEGMDKSDAPFTIISSILPDISMLKSSEELVQERIQKLEYKVSELEQQLVKSEKQLVQKVDTSLTNRLAGKILLQVEGNGEAWYVDKDTQKKFYLKDGNTAYTALRAFGLGITNKDLAKIPVGSAESTDKIDIDGDGLVDSLESAIGTDPNNKDSDGDGYLDGEELLSGYSPLGVGKIIGDSKLTNRLNGKILLQVESRGEAWYVLDGKRYYMGDGDSAYQVMRSKSLGIKNDDLRKISVGEF